MGWNGLMGLVVLIDFVMCSAALSIITYGESIE
jgi:hypothetical protein